MRLRALIFTLLALLTVLAADVLAHGEPGHVRNEAGPVIKEQTPWGIAGNIGEATRKVNVTMTDDMRFVPDQFSFMEGETIQLSVTNGGALMHELVIGDEASLREHAEWMVKFPEMEHDEPYMAHVPPGETMDLVWTFNRTGEFRFACLIPGHYQAGMIGGLSVTRPPSATTADQAETVAAHAHSH